ncbi:hypothetical protein [Streptomyces glaucescens]|uniref:hypothetical protein n=1 Tax=Streptomyces glaucescens TaxID=1907 RepID=UPI000A3D57A8|nr:hypothetical protein [Streptomyces glaucescens]
MSVDRVPGLVLPVVFLLAVVGVAVALWWERRWPSSPTRQPTRRAGERAAAEASRPNALYRP